MKIARIGSVSATAAITVCAAGALWSTEVLLHQEADPLLRLAANAVAIAALSGAVLLPLGWLIDRGISRFVRHLHEASEQREAPAFDGPAWLRPVAGAAVSVLGHWRERAEAAEARIREVEIRHRISEADRKHTEAILHSLRDAVLVTDGFNEVMMANQAAGELLGFQPHKAVHQPIDRVVSDVTLRDLIKDVRETANLAYRKHLEHTIATSDDSESNQTYDVTLTCLPNSQQQVGGVVTILHDISREKEISELKSDFVSKASHELRTPLSSIRAYVEMLLDGEATDEDSRREFYEIIQNEANRLGRLIDNMLNISRMEAGIIQVDRAEVDFVEVADEVIEVMKPQAEDKKISLARKSGPERFIADADRDMMYQVLLNLVSNGIKYTPEGGRVTVAIENDEAVRSVLVTVADTGLGIPPDAVDKLFQKFYRVENYKRVAKGTGLGLNLVKHIVETVHSGQIGVHSELGMGSRFWFNIPYQYQGADADPRARGAKGMKHVPVDP